MQAMVMPEIVWLGAVKSMWNGAVMCQILNWCWNMYVYAFILVPSTVPCFGCCTKRVQLHYFRNKDGPNWLQGLCCDLTLRFKCVLHDLGEIFKLWWSFGQAHGLVSYIYFERNCGKLKPWFLISFSHFNLEPPMTFMQTKAWGNFLISLWELGFTGANRQLRDEVVLLKCCCSDCWMHEGLSHFWVSEYCNEKSILKTTGL